MTHLYLTAEHEHALSYHQLSRGRGEFLNRLRDAAKAYADIIDQICPPSREHLLAFTAVQESLMWANAAVAIHQDRLNVVADLPRNQ